MRENDSDSIVDEVHVYTHVMEREEMYQDAVGTIFSVFSLDFILSSTEKEVIIIIDSHRMNEKTLNLSLSARADDDHGPRKVMMLLN